MSGPNGEGPLDQPVNVSVRFTTTDDLEILANVDHYATGEHRNRSQMIRVLLIEAVTARQRSEKDTS